MAKTALTHPIQPGEPCRVYRNLNKGGQWMVQVYREGSWNQTTETPAVTLANVTPFYGQGHDRKSSTTPDKALARVVSRGKRDVIAKLEGTFVGFHGTTDGTPVTYNPLPVSKGGRGRGDFHTRDGASWNGAALVSLPSGASCAYAS